jgi:hypothetical protein
MKKILIVFQYFLLNTYSWAELTIILGADNYKDLTQIFEEIRSIKLREVDNYEKIVDNSFYLAKGNEKSRINETFCFIDTHSCFGIDKLYLEKLRKKSIEDIKIAISSIKLYTQIEFQLKPGHYRAFVDKLKRLNFTCKETGKKEIIFENVFRFKTGKTDIILIEVNPEDFINNVILYRELHKKKSRLLQHIRKTKTITQFDSTFSKKISGTPKVLDLKLTDYAFNNIKQIDELSRSLSLSRQTRMKIMKVFHNYNNAIVDPVLFIYYIDFKRFLEGFLNELQRYNQENKYYLDNKTSKNASVAEIEKIISIYLNAFEEAYLDRALNNFHYEEINDFNVDFNSSVSSIISTLDSTIKLISAIRPTKINVVNKNDEKAEKLPEYKKGLLVRLNDINTETNGISVNYNVHHLIEPSLIFVTIGKELFNPSIIKDTSYLTFNINVNKVLNANQITKNIEFDSSYLILDKLIFAYTFNFNLELFEYWTWVYTLQNSAQYDSVGMLSNQKFIETLIRILSIRKFYFGDDPSKPNCPVPEIRHQWNKYFDVIESLVKELENPIEIPTELFKQRLILIAPDGIIENETIDKYYDELEDGALSNPVVFKRYQKYISIYNLPTRKQSFQKRFAILEKMFELYESNDFDTINDIYNAANFGMKVNILSYLTLKQYMKDNKGEIHLLRRELDTGFPIADFIKQKKTGEEYSLYFVDPNGDYFHPSVEIFKQKMKFNHQVLYSLWDASMKDKIKLFNVEI